VTFPYRSLQFSERLVLDDVELLARIARSGSAFAVVLRDPGLSTSAQFARGVRFRNATRAVGAGLLVADRLDLALLLDADGVHLGRASVSVADARTVLGQRWVTRSAHDVDEAACAAADGADAVVLSPIFASPGKGAPLGLGALRQTRRVLLSTTSLVALGGVTAGNAAECFEAGAHAVAGIRADLSEFSR